jgi:hypothetical protein
MPVSRCTRMMRQGEQKPRAAGMPIDREQLFGASLGSVRNLVCGPV